MVATITYLPHLTPGSHASTVSSAACASNAATSHHCLGKKYQLCYTTSTSVHFLLSFHRPLKSQTCFQYLDTILRLEILRTSTGTRVSHSRSYQSRQLRKEAGLQEGNAGALAGWERSGHRVWWPNMAAASRLSEAVRRRHPC